MLQQAAVAIRDRVQLVEKVREESDVISLNLHQLGQLRGIVLMMRNGVVRLGDAHLRVTALAEFTGQHEGENARLIGLICQGEEIEHELRVLVVGIRHTDRRRRNRD